MVKRRVICEVCQDTGHDLSFRQPCTSCNFLRQVDGLNNAMRELKLEPTSRATRTYLEAAAFCDGALSATSVVARVKALRRDPLIENLDSYRSPRQKAFDGLRGWLADVKANVVRLNVEGPVEHLPETLWMQAVAEVAAEMQDLEERSAAIRQARGQYTRYRNSRSGRYRKPTGPRFTRMDRIAVLKRSGVVPISYVGHWSVPILGACTACKSESYFSNAEIRSRQAKCQVCFLSNLWRTGDTQRFGQYCLRHFELKVSDQIGEPLSELVGECAKCGSSCQSSFALVVTGRVAPCATCLASNSGVIYLARNEENGVLKIGRSTAKSFRDRSKDHSSRGWQIVHSWNVPSRAVAEAVEAQVLTYVRHHLELEIAVREDAMPQGGYSETFAGKSRRVDDVMADVTSLVNEVIRPLL